MPRTVLLLFILISASSCSIFKPIPQPEREFRGFWVATVVNIDWPKNGNDVIEKQKADYLEILDFYEDLNFNATIVQIRTAGDAFYDSKYAPWSRFLTGEEGKAPNTEESVLNWMIDEAHNRGMEFHAWLNPYRATFDLKTEILSPTHDFNLHPEWVLKYGKKYYYNPGLPEVRQRMVSVIDEIVSNYDVDAIHFDDYFYPYTIKDEVFRDSLTYDYHKLQNQSLEDWRRSNMDSLIKNSYETIKARKPWVQFGVSPFGVWKNNSTDPKGSDTRAGQTTYENLYADPLLWMKEGWLDYLVPQVYWSMKLPVASHRKIVDWWADNSTNTNLYIGNGPYKIRNNSDKAWDNKKELPTQLTYARNKQAVQGNVFFSAKSLMQNNDDVVKRLRKRYYKREALPPISSYVKIDSPSKLEFKSLQKIDNSIVLNFNDLTNYRFITIYPSGKKSKGNYPIKKLVSKIPVDDMTSLKIPEEIIRKRKYIALIFIDRYGHESEPKILHLNQTN
ncbi:glycoside hydrolase family 10 protein [Maribacter halichondriae]|uniref:glycoside hydrolase family 10 protein n=1 Tax=Maribacter halichondriae TaxID=2980554 RepID=UPI002358648D|nr:family 10 glycosylhydrolase [Maribacter sp. Hal144]